MGKKKPRPRRSFTPEFKAEIIALCKQGDRSVGRVAKDFDLTETAVRDWVKQAEIDTGDRDGLTTSEREELARLRRENTRLRQDVDVLKRATLDSTGQGNTLGWGAESQALTRTVVELRRDGVKVVLAERRQVCAFGQVLPEQFVGVLVGATLPGATRGCEEHVDTGVGGEPLVGCQFHAAIPGQRAA
ncbi:transposase [Streptomyces sp. SID5474]|nr:transposase [Streptomyces sp. SID5474]